MFAVPVMCSDMIGVSHSSPPLSSPPPPLPSSDSDLFTSTLDMVSTLLSWMTSDFLLVPMVTGDEGKKTTVSIIRKLKVSHTTTDCRWCSFAVCGGAVLAVVAAGGLWLPSAYNITSPSPPLPLSLHSPPLPSPPLLSSPLPCRVTLLPPSPPVYPRSVSCSPSPPRCWR